MLRHRRPVSHPFPNAYSHPLPRFSYEQETRQITVSFTCDPSYPSSASGRDAAVSAWKDNTYMMTALPIRKPRTILDDATALLSNAISSPLSLFGGHSAPANTRPHEVFDDGDIDLREDEILEQERSEEGEVDDSAEKYRPVRVLGFTKEDGQLAGERAKARRQWIVTPLRNTRNRNIRELDATI